MPDLTDEQIALLYPSMKGTPKGSSKPSAGLSYPSMKGQASPTPAEKLYPTMGGRAGEGATADPAGAVGVKDGQLQYPSMETEPSATDAGAGGFTLPDGIEADAGLLEEFRPLVRELGLSREHAQRLVDLHARSIEKQRVAWEDQVDAWGEAARSDREFGGEGFETNAAAAREVIRRFGTPALRQALEETGLGNHPELVRLLVRGGRRSRRERTHGPRARRSRGAGLGRRTESVRTLPQQGHGLSRAERETHLWRSEEETEWEVFTESPAVVRMLERRGYRGEPVGLGLRFRLPAQAVTIRSRGVVETASEVAKRRTPSGFAKRSIPGPTSDPFGKESPAETTGTA